MTDGAEHTREVGGAPGFRVPPEAIPFLLLQRSGYRWQPLYRLFSLLGAGGLYKRHVTRTFVETRRAATVGRLYRADVEETLDRVGHLLPARLTTVVDIGGGIGGMSLGLWSRHADSIRALHLLDRSAVTPDLYFGFRREAAFYNSLEQASRFLLLNGVPAEVIHTVDVGTDAYPTTESDVVISTFAWGFHFPIETYLDEVRRTLHADGVAVLHVREGTDGETELRRAFRDVRRVWKGRTSHLVVASGPRR